MKQERTDRASAGLSELLRRQHAEREPSEDEITWQRFRSLNTARYERAEPNFLGV